MHFMKFASENETLIAHNSFIIALINEILLIDLRKTD